GTLWPKKINVYAGPLCLNIGKVQKSELPTLGTTTNNPLLRPDIRAVQPTQPTVNPYSLQSELAT
ncbi:MAG: hypothetical protein NTU50_04095, partial [Actinobacteria bacterium]|nr:hypothetical protein [Actinomycetota bacterium]